MACKHEHLRCTDNVYFCADCGCSWVAPDKEEKPVEAQKKPIKRKARKGEE